MLHRGDIGKLDLRRGLLTNNHSQPINESGVVSRQLQQGSRLRSHLHNGVVRQPDQQHKLLPQPVRGPLVHLLLRLSARRCVKSATAAHWSANTKAGCILNPTQKYWRTVAPPPPYLSLRFLRRLLSSHDPGESAIWQVRTAGVGAELLGGVGDSAQNVTVE